MYVVSPVYGRRHYGENDTLYKIPVIHKLKAVQKAAGDQAAQQQPKQLEKQQEKKYNPVGPFRDHSLLTGCAQPRVLLSEEQTPFNKRYESMQRAYKRYGSLQQ